MKDRENTPRFSQTLQWKMGSLAAETSATQEMVDLEKNGQAERTNWVLSTPEPPSLWRELMDSVLPKGGKLSSLNKKGGFNPVVCLLQAVFPIICWSRNYRASKFKNDLLAGLTLASLCIPQSIGYATLARLDPQYGLYTSVVPPLIYAVMGTSREIAIGPVAVVSLLLAAMVQRVENPVENPVAYRNLVLTTTFFVGIFQATFGLLRLGFLVDFLSHAAVVGFMAGAAIVIGLQQLKGLLGLTHFTNKTDIISVLKATWISLHHSWSPQSCILGCSFLCFILITRFVGKRNKKLFWLAAISPLVSVILSTLLVYLTRADKHGINIIKHIKRGLNPSSIHQLQLHNSHTLDAAKIGLVVAVIALAEALAVGRSFASIKGYRIDGNKEMIAMGVMNTLGSLSSCYVATGSFSRSAVNFSAGCETAMSNIVMSITVIISLELCTKLLYFTPTAILASVILSALPGLIDLHEAYKIWKIDKLDFLACIGAFLGVLFVSVEVGLLAAVTISFLKIIITTIQPGIEVLGRIPGTDVFCNVDQYPMTIKTDPVLIFRVKSGLICFANANFIQEKIIKRAIQDQEEGNTKENEKISVQLVILDMSNLVNIDTAGIASLQELHKNLLSNGIEMAIVNPRWQVINKLKLANFVEKMRGKVFLTVKEAVDECLNAKNATI